MGDHGKKIDKFYVLSKGKIFTSKELMFGVDQSDEAYCFKHEHSINELFCIFQ